MPSRPRSDTSRSSWTARRTSGGERSAGLDGVIDGGGRDDDDIGALADRQTPAIVLPCGYRRIDACSAERAVERQRLVGRERRSPRGPPPVLAPDGEGDPG